MRDALNKLMESSLDTVAPAITLVRYQNGKQIFSGAWGYINPDTKTIPVTLATLFDLASITKLFTTTAFLVLASEQNINPKTPLVEFIPEFGEIGPRNIDGGQDPHTRLHLSVPTELTGQQVDPANVTLWHLLTHTSGLPPWRDVFTIAPPPTPSHTPTSAQRWQLGLERLISYAFVDRIGKSIRYSDIGLMLLGEVVARLNNSTLDEAIQRHVTRRLNLQSVMFNPTHVHNIDKERIAPTEMDTLWRKERVWGYVHDENAHGLGGIAGHAGLFGTADNVARFGQAWLQGDVLSIAPALRTEAIREQVSQNSQRRGLGWVLRANTYGHTGFTGTSLYINPEQQTVTVLLTNRVYYGRESANIQQLRRVIHEEWQW